MRPQRDEPSTRLRSQAKLIFGTSLAIAVQMVIGQAALLGNWKVLPGAIAGSVLFGCVSLALFQLVFPRFTGLPRGRRLLLQVLIALVSMAATAFVVVGVSMWFESGRSIFSAYTGGDVTFTVPAHALAIWPYLYCALIAVPAALLAVVGFNQSWWQIFLLERREQQAREQAALAQLEALRAQIHPHFLFNSLNSIAQLISSDPTRAEECVERLAEIFRYLLQRDGRTFVTLADELRIADAYLDIERARFGDRLTVDFSVAGDARGTMVPALILQPLIENAVRHGVSRKVGGGRVSIEAGMDEGELRVVVRDTGIGMGQGIDKALAAGVGLRNVHDRLVQLYGPEYAPAIDSHPGQGTTITVRVPPAAIAGVNGQVESAIGRVELRR